MTLPQNTPHHVKVELGKGYTFLTSVCPFDPADQERPCWPHNEDGTPFDVEQGIKDGCVYADWVGEHDVDRFTNTVTVTFELTATWRNDCFDFEFGKQVTDA